MIYHVCRAYGCTYYRYVHNAEFCMVHIEGTYMKFDNQLLSSYNIA